MTLRGKVCTVHTCVKFTGMWKPQIETEMTRQGKHVQQELTRAESMRQ
jgi:hypothetical protein